MALKLGKVSAKDFAWGQRVRRWLHSLLPTIFHKVFWLGVDTKGEGYWQADFNEGTRVFLDMMLTHLKLKGMSGPVWQK